MPVTTPARGLCLVRAAVTEETIPGGRILLPQSVREDMAAYQFEVLAVGLDAYCEDWDDCERPHFPMPVHRGEPMRIHPKPHNLIPGAWVVVKHRSLAPSDDPHGKTFYVRQDDVLAVLRAS